MHICIYGHLVYDINTYICFSCVLLYATVLLAALPKSALDP